MKVRRSLNKIKKSCQYVVVPTFYRYVPRDSFTGHPQGSNTNITYQKSFSMDNGAIVIKTGTEAVLMRFILELIKIGTSPIFLIKNFFTSYYYST